MGNYTCESEQEQLRRSGYEVVVKIDHPHLGEIYKVQQGNVLEGGKTL
jgi:hypothetical protein